jgi:hypothetical protein
VSFLSAVFVALLVAVPLYFLLILANGDSKPELGVKGGEAGSAAPDTPPEPADHGV